MKNKIIIIILLVLLFAVISVLIYKKDSCFKPPSIRQSDNQKEIGYPKSYINIKCTSMEEYENKGKQLDIFCDIGYVLDCDYDNYCECARLVPG